MPTSSFDTTIVITKKSVQSLIDILENENVPHVDLKTLKREETKMKNNTTDWTTSFGAISGMICHPNDEEELK